MIKMYNYHYLHFNNVIKFSCLLFLCIALCNCISIQKDGLSKISKNSIQKPYKKIGLKINGSWTIYHNEPEVSSFVGPIIYPTAEESSVCLLKVRIADFPGIFCEVAREIAINANAKFVPISSEGEIPSDLDAILTIDISRSTDTGKYDPYFSFAHKLSIGIIPMITNIDWSSSLSLLDLNNGQKRTASYSGGFKLIRHLIFIPLAPFADGYYQNDLKQIENISNLAIDLVNGTNPSKGNN
jgi:hypothetical protein